MKTLLKVSTSTPHREALLSALREAGLDTTEVQDWDDAKRRMPECGNALVICGDPAAQAEACERLLAALGKATPGSAIPRDTMRALSHELRTPLSAMAGWLHLLDSGKLDEDGTKRAIAKLRGNIEDEVRTIDKFLGATSQEGQR